MPNPLLVPVFLRELVCSRTLPREPEPDLVMDSESQVKAYALAGRIDGVMASSYLFHSARISQTIQGCATVLDLGCGPATQLCQVAELNERTRFIGVDLSSEMLDNAKHYAAECRVKNVEFVQDDITRLSSIADRSCDAVISTMALHHLPSDALLENCFRNITRVLKPGGAIYLTDFGRLKSLKSVLFFAYMNAKHQPHIFSLDYERSLRAAFLLEDFQRAAREFLPNEVLVMSTFRVPFLVIIKTKDRALEGNIRQKLMANYAKLPGKYRRDLNDMRTFFALGGLKNDPFKGQV